MKLIEALPDTKKVVVRSIKKSRRENVVNRDMQGRPPSPNPGPNVGGPPPSNAAGYPPSNAAGYPPSNAGYAPPSNTGGYPPSNAG